MSIICLHQVVTDLPMNDFSRHAVVALSKAPAQLASGCFPVLMCRSWTQSNVILNRHKAARQGSINPVCTIVSALFRTITWAVHNHEHHPGLPLRQMVRSILQHGEMQLLQVMTPIPLIQVCSTIVHRRKEEMKRHKLGFKRLFWLSL